MHLLRYTLALILCVIFAGVCLAQEHSDYHLYGSVKDSKGTPVPGAKLQLKNKEDGKEIIIKVKDDGTFDQQFIPHAVYVLTVTKEGFEPRKVDPFDLSPVAQQTIQRKIDVVLVTGEEEQKAKMAEQQAQMAKEVQAEYQKGVDLFGQKKFDETIATMQDVSKKSPDSYGPYLVLGAAYQSKGDCDNALPMYDKAISIKKDIPDAYRYEGDCYVSKKDYPKAMDAYTNYLNINAADSETRCILANLFLAAEKMDDAGTHLTKALQDSPNTPICHKVNGEYLLRKGDMKGASADFKKYLELQPDAPDKAQIQEMIQAIDQGK